MDLLEQFQLDPVQQTFRDIAETWAFPITIIQTNYTDAAFNTAPDATTEFELYAFKDFQSENDTDDRFRNVIGPAGSHEVKIYIDWQLIVDNGLADVNNKSLLDHNDLIRMDGEIFEIAAQYPIALFTKTPTFLSLYLARRFQNTQGAANP